MDRKRPSQRKFGAGARTVIAGAAMTAVIGGWNLVGHLDAAKAESSPEMDLAKQGTPDIVFPTVTPTAVGLLPSLAVTPIPTLPPRTQYESQTTGGQPVSTGALNLPALPAFAPLPTMAPLPQLPSLPQAPAGAGGTTGRQSSGGS
ncbi:MAG: hypothetical protein IPK16_27320 [Anaerolineales bacterium]|nr:hypothetical protein [Anaerolineales bacterium]